jgi:hypothetical protein
MPMIHKPRKFPEWLWEATGELYREGERIDGEAMNAGQVEQSEDAHEATWREAVGAIILKHAQGPKAPWAARRKSS